MSRARSIGGSPSTSSDRALQDQHRARGSPRSPSSWNCRRPRWKSSREARRRRREQRPARPGRAGGSGSAARRSGISSSARCADHRRERSAAELVAHAVAVGIGGIVAVAERRSRASRAREEHVALDAQVDLQRLARRSPRTSASVPFQPNGFTTRSASTPLTPDVSISPFGVDAQHAEVDALWRPADLACGAGARRVARAGRRVAAAGRALISRASAWTTPSPTSAGGFRSSPLAVRSPSPLRNALSVSAPAPFGPPTQWQEGHEMVSGPPKTPSCTRRNGPVCVLAAAPPPRPSAKPYSCSKRSCPRSASSSRQTSPGGDARRIERGAHLAQEGARRRRPRGAAARGGARRRGARRARPPG